MQSPALFPSSLLLLLCGSARAFSVPSATAGNAILFQHRLVEHTDQLQQRRQNRDHDHGDSDSDSELVPPPHLFCIPAPGGDVCLVVDENGAYHAVRDACPPLGLPLSQTAVVDSQVTLSVSTCKALGCSRQRSRDLYAEQLQEGRSIDHNCRMYVCGTMV